MDTLIKRIKKKLTYNGEEYWLTGSDGKALADGWITSGTIDYFLAEYAKNHKIARLKYKVFDNAFYRMLIDNRPKPHVFSIPAFVDAGLQLADYPRMQTREWLSLADQQAVFIPLNQSNHWILVVFCQVAAEDRTTPDLPDAALFLFDSYQEYLTEEALESVAGELRAYITCVRFFHKHEERQCTPQNCPLVRMAIPQQTNKNDCGLYVIQSARALISRLEIFGAMFKTHRANLSVLRGFVEDEVSVGDDVRKDMLDSVLPKH